MEQVNVRFEYHTGIRHCLFRNVRLRGSWTQEGLYSDDWHFIPMEWFRDSAGCVAFRAEMSFPESEKGKRFYWGVLLDDQGRADMWGIMSNTGMPEAVLAQRGFILEHPGQVESYFVAPGRFLGANKHHAEGKDTPGIVFSVWAPHAQKAEVLVADDGAGGYIWDDGRGTKTAYSMNRGDDGIWRTDAADAAFADFHAWEGKRYMFRITREDGSVVLRSDLFSRRQAGTGGKNPAEAEWNGQPEDLDCSQGCSVVKDPDGIREHVQEGRAEGVVVSEEDFWKNEFNPLRPLPTSLEDLVIYEMHVAGLGAGKEGPGTLEDAEKMLDYLAELGVNAVELLPMSCFEGVAGWGYGSSHFYAIKYESPEKDQFKHFVRACHQRGMAVIVDVVYNHYSQFSNRTYWMYDSPRHDRNMWYYFKGKQEDYPENFPEGGYCDNFSTGYLPNMAEEMVRKALIGSAVMMAVDYHVDGFRMDLTQALHGFNVLHLDGSPVPEANEAGIQFMREWVATLRLFKPTLLLFGEDHSSWNMVARTTLAGGIGFDAVWWSEWYHQLIGDASEDESKARLLRNAGYGTNKALKMNVFAGIMLGSPGRVVYHESHDESGNSQNSGRNIEIAVNNMLFDNTRGWAEERCRAVAGMTLLSAGTPMFFMGEEVCAQKPYRFGDFLENREDYLALKEGMGADMFRFYRDCIRLRKENPALRSPLVEIIKVHNQHRLLVYRRWLCEDEFLIIVGLNGKAFANGYVISHKNLKGKSWREVWNGDALEYGGCGVLNENIMESGDGNLNLRIPSCPVVVLTRMN